jgi:hypothetical protein
MATNTEVGVKITVDGSEASSSTKKLRDDVVALKTELKGLQKGTEEYEQKLKQVNEAQKQLDEFSGLGNLKRQLKDATVDLIAMRAKFGETSDEAIKAAKRVAQLKDEIGDAKAFTDAFNPDAKFKVFGQVLQGVAGGFAAIQGAQAVFGAESKELEETLVKVQGALALSQGIDSVLESADAFQTLGAKMAKIPIIQRIITAAQFLWNAAVSANPIGALVTVIVALIAAGAALIKFFINSSNEAKRNEEAVKANTKALEQQTKANERAADQLQRNQKYTLELAKANGASSKEIRALELKLIAEKIALIESARATALSTVEKNKNYLATLKQNGASDELIKKQQEVTNKSVEEANKQTKNLDAANIERLELIRRQNVEVIKEQKKAEEDAANKAKENREKQLQKEKDAAEKRKQQREEEQKKRLEQQKEFEKQRAEQQNVQDDFITQKRAQQFKNEFDRKQFELSVQNQQEIDKQVELLNKKLITDADFNLRKEVIDADFAAKQAENEAARQADKISKEDAETKRRLDAEKAASEERIAAAAAEAKAKEEIETAYLNTFSAGINLLKMLGEKNKGVQKVALIAENAVTIAKIILDTQKSIAASNFAANLVPPLLPPGIPNKAWFVAKALAAKQIAFAKVNAGIGIATSIAATAKGLSQLGGGSAGGGSSVGGGASAPAANFPSAPLTPQAETTLLNQGQVNQIGNVAARAYVVESDVSGNQQRIQRLERAARIA